MPKKKADIAPAAEQPESSVAGHTIVEVRPMTRAELKKEGWETGRHLPPTVLVLDNGTKLYPSRDEEGNGPGAMFGADAKGSNFMLS
jgi:hypothetical protein